MQAQPEKKQHRFKMPSAFTILFIIIIIIAVLSWFIPAGKYSTDSSGNLIANTYHTVKSNPQGLWDVVMSPVYGMVGDKNTDGAISVSLFILVIGGLFGRRQQDQGAGRRDLVNRQPLQGARKGPDPDFDDPLRPRWFHLRDGRRNGRLLPALDPGDDGLWL